MKVPSSAVKAHTEMKLESSSEMKYRIGELLFYLYAEQGMITATEYEALRNWLLDTYKPVIGELERNMSWEIRKSLK